MKDTSLVRPQLPSQTTPVARPEQTALDRVCKTPEVLIVDDEQAVRGVLAFALRRHGLIVRQADCGREAIRLYQRHRDTIDVVLQDVQMPGMDGVELLLALQDLNPAVRVVFMSGQGGNYSAEDLLALGAKRILLKPFSSLAEVAQSLWQVVRAGSLKCYRPMPEMT